MYQFLLRLLAAARKHGQRPKGRASLRVESLEDRHMPSTVLSPLAVPMTMPAPTANTETALVQPVVNPEQAVHGYKWRRPRPWGQIFKYQGDAEAPLAAQQVSPAQTTNASRLVMGGADNLTVLLGGAGHAVVRPPEGPLPTEIVFAKQ
jgi:hypothetical protein